MSFCSFGIGAQSKIVGRYARFHVPAISHETIYRRIWRDKKHGGALHVHLRRANKPFRKRYAHYDSRGRLVAMRPAYQNAARNRLLLRFDKRFCPRCCPD